ncbi:MAG: HAMP domain-containing protein [Candidatus Eisenbacteria bacterium]|nr:HAMP domain-containing protein [Candidatus Eisenbacteria bacterium]
MPKKRLLWQVFPSYLGITLLALLAAALLAASALRSFHLQHTVADLESRLPLFRAQIEPYFQRDDPQSAVDAACKRLGRISDTRVTVIVPNGRVIGDSDEDPARMELHTGFGRPEIADALLGTTGCAVRFSETLRRRMVYVAQPIFAKPQPTRIVAAVRASIPLGSVRGNLRALYGRMLLGLAVVVVVAAFASLWVSRRLSGLLDELRRGAEAFARGELQHRLPPSTVTEVAQLSESMNTMAAQLDQRIETITRHRNEQQAILSSMAEGVLAVDSEHRVVSMNAGCAHMLQIDSHRARGRTIQEVVRNPALQKLIDRTLASPLPVEGDVVLRDPDTRYLQVHGAMLHDAQNQRIGAVLVLNDVTRLHRLERMRRDFVANVSHELKTPITSIKGAVETLRDGALAAPEDAERFLRIIARQSQRLNAIVDDLLNLSRIELEAERTAIARHDSRICQILSSALQTCQSKADQKQIAVEIDCPQGLRAEVNGELLESALVNLIDNAIKYSDPRKPVRIAAESRAGMLEISVADEGSGIAEEHLDRIFERFYRVDKARSRQMGGTGLGLAIVKHIAKAHGGHVTVESRLGRGSTFRICLPVAQA